MPNVSHCIQEVEVHYNPWVETKLVVYYDIQDVSSPTTVCTNYDSSIKSMEVDGKLLDNVVAEYQFDSVGEHVIKYEFNEPTKIGNEAPLFNNLTEVRYFIIPSTFNSIGNNAFLSENGFLRIDIPNNITSIGKGAFWSPFIREFFYNAQAELTVKMLLGDYNSYYPNLEKVVIGNSPKILGEGCFHDCINLTNITIGSGVTDIGDGFCYKCTNLTSVIVEATTPPTLGTDAFNYNASGRKIYVPSASVEAYKTTSGWSTYASDIQAIP